MRRREVVIFGLVIALMSDLLCAADISAPAGTWCWAFINGNKDEVELKVKLKYEDGSLSGTFINAAKKEITIEDASFKNGEVLFTVTQEMTPTANFVTKFKGKLDGDTIKGTRELTIRGKTTSYEWEATREKN